MKFRFKFPFDPKRGPRILADPKRKFSEPSRTWLPLVTICLLGWNSRLVLPASTLDRVEPLRNLPLLQGSTGEERRRAPNSLVRPSTVPRARQTKIGGASNRPPNVVLIVSDDQGWTDFGFMGHSVVRTPHLDKLASESAVFPNGYVPTSLCRASLATLLTGLFASQHKICCNDPPDSVARETMHPFIQSTPTVPRLLQQLGYRSLQTGKFWEGHYSNGGFTHGMTEKGRHGDTGLAIGRQTMQPIYDFIDASGSRPFFVWYAPMMPHDPHTPPERILKKYAVEGRNEKLAKYWAMCEWFDETCGELLGFLDRRSLRDNTLVVFVVDNGWIQETGAVRTTRGWFAPKSKLSPYDGGLRTPVMLRWPGHTKPARHDDLVSTIDLAPTILSACGINPPGQMPGLSLLPVAAGKSKLKRDAVFGEIFLHTSVDIDKPVLNLTHLWVRRGDWKLIRFLEDGTKSELYKVAGDPHERQNLAEEEPRRARRLEKMLERWQGDRNESSILYIDPDPRTGTSKAVVVGRYPLAHTAQLLPSGTTGDIVGRNDPTRQVEQLFANLAKLLTEARSTWNDVVKINFYVTHSSTIPRVHAALARKFNGRVKPAASFIVGTLAHPEAFVALDAIAVSKVGVAPTGRRFRAAALPGAEPFAHVAILPAGGGVYVSGQAERGELAEATRKTMESLLTTLTHLGLSRTHIIQLKAFMRPMSNVESVRKEMTRFFENELRPNYYDPRRPPAASKAMVHSAGLPGQTVSLDMIAVPTRK